MNKLLLAAVAALALVTPASAKDPAFPPWPKNSQFSCTGVLVKDEYSYRLRPDKGMLPWCWCDADLWEGKEIQVLKTCSLDDRCEIKGVIKGHGAFVWTKIDSVRKVAPPVLRDTFPPAYRGVWCNVGKNLFVKAKNESSCPSDFIYKITATGYTLEEDRCKVTRITASTSEPNPRSIDVKVYCNDGADPENAVKSGDMRLEGQQAPGALE